MVIHTLKTLALVSAFNLSACNSAGNKVNARNDFPINMSNNVSQSQSQASGHSNNVLQPKPIFLFFIGHEYENILYLSGNEKSFTIQASCTPEQDQEYLHDCKINIYPTKGTSTLTTNHDEMSITCNALYENLKACINNGNGETVLSSLRTGRVYNIKPHSSEVEYTISITDKQGNTIESLKVIWKQ